MRESDAEGDEEGSAVSVSRAERTAACLAMVGFWLCSVLGALLVLWWARRRRSVFAQRYALASLTLEGLVLTALVLYLPVFFLGSNLVVIGVFVLLWLLQVLLGVYALVLAVYAGRGRDVGSAPIPNLLIKHLPNG